ncbi:MAG: hypothetical protein JNK05_38385 [Myxococcales bacterium]|nr:hypothetical protein [Myxococcales bacterium]
MYQQPGPFVPQGQGGQLPPGYRVPVPQSDYQFNELECSVISELSDNAGFFGGVALVFGVVGTLGSFFSLVSGQGKTSGLVSVVGLLVQGIFARSASQSFKSVLTSTSGHIHGTLDALQSLNRFYLTMCVVGGLNVLVSLFNAARLMTSG